MLCSGYNQTNRDLVSSHTAIEKLEQKTEAFGGLGKGLFTFLKKIQNKPPLEHLVPAFYFFVL